MCSLTFLPLAPLLETSFPPQWLKAFYYIFFYYIYSTDSLTYPGQCFHFSHAPSAMVVFRVRTLPKGIRSLFLKTNNKQHNYYYSFSSKVPSAMTEFCSLSNVPCAPVERAVNLPGHWLLRISVRSVYYAIGVQGCAGFFSLFFWMLDLFYHIAGY